MRFKMDNSNLSAFAVYKAKKVVNLPKNKLKRVKPEKVKAKIAKKTKLYPKEVKVKEKSLQNGEKVKRKSKTKKKVIEHVKTEDEEPPELVEPQENVEINELSDNSSYLETDDKDDNPLEDAKKLLKWILEPLTPEDFFQRCWESTPMHIYRKNQDYYKHILSSKKLDEMLRDNPLYYTRNVDIVSYENGVRETHNPEGRAIPSAVWDYYQNGCSVRILNPQTYNKKIQLLLATLQEYFGTMVGANVYLTPPGSQGFAPHYDDIEAFVLQLEGRKYWKLYAPQNKNDFLARDSSANLSRDQLGPLIKEVTLKAGSILYFPRGTVHEAKTDSESHSLHLTVSVYQQTCYADLFEKLLPAAIQKAASENIEFRSGLPLNYLQNVGAANSKLETERRSNILNTVQRLLTDLSKYVDVDAAADQLGRKFMHDAVPPILTSKEKKCSVKEDGEFLCEGTVRNKVQFTPDTEIRLVRYYSIRLAVENGQAKIYYCTENSKVYHEEEEQFLEVENEIVPAVELLLHSYPKYTKIEMLPIQDEAQKIQVVSDLWERGILVTKRPLDCVDD